MRIEDLRLFVTVADMRSMTAAAKRLYLTPQNVSKTISKMESELKTELLTRTRQGIYLTEQGHKLYETASEVLVHWADFERDVVPRTTKAQLRGRVSVLVSPQLSNAFFTFVRTFQEENPNVTVSLHNQDTLIVDDTTINEADYDLVFTSYEESWLAADNIHPNHRRVRTFLWGIEPLRLFFRKHCSLTDGKTVITNEMLNSMPLVLFYPADEPEALHGEALRRSDIVPTYVFSSNNLGQCQAYIMGGTSAFLDTAGPFGSTFDAFLRQEIASLPLREQINICHVAFVRKSEDISPAARAFTEFFIMRFGMQEVDDLRFATLR